MGRLIRNIEVRTVLKISTATDRYQWLNELVHHVTQCFMNTLKGANTFPHFNTACSWTKNTA